MDFCMFATKRTAECKSFKPYLKTSIDCTEYLISDLCRFAIYTIIHIDEMQILNNITETLDLYLGPKP